MANEWICPNCRMVQQYPALTNHCLHCNTPAVSSRLSSIGEYPKVVEPPEITCFAPTSKPLPVFLGANPNSETLYVIGLGDALAIAEEQGDFYKLLLPQGETGYVEKSGGIVIEVGLGEVAEPLGYVRWFDRRFAANVTSVQPDGKTVTLHTLTNDDRLPIVEEREHTFKVQLPSGVRGWVDRSRVVKAVSKVSLKTEEKEGASLSSVLGSALLIGLVLAGAAARDSKE